MVTILPKDERDWGNVGRGFGAGLTEGYMNRSDEKAIQKAVSDLGPNPGARDLLNAITNTKTYSPAAKQQVLKNYMGIEEFEETKRKAKAQEEIEMKKIEAATQKAQQKAIQDQQKSDQLNTMLENTDLPQDEKDQLKEAPNDVKTAAYKDWYKSKHTNKKLTPLESRIMTKQADEYMDIQKYLPKGYDAIKNLDAAQKLSDNIGPLRQGAALVGASGKFRELEGLVLPAIEPILKIFNPVGAIPLGKMQLLRDQYAIKATDIPSVRTAKIKVLKQFTEQMIARSEARLEMMNSTDGIVPQKDLDKFDRESETLVDAMLDFDLTAEEATNAELPPPQQWKGETVQDPDGNEYYSDGNRWVKR